jgi:hypothetical protein
MIASELVDAIRSHRGKVFVRVALPGESLLINVRKADLVDLFVARGEEETGAALIVTEKGAVLDAWRT